MSALIVDAVEGTGEEEVLADVNRRSTLTFRLCPIAATRSRCDATVLGECDQRTVVDDATPRNPCLSRRISSDTVHPAVNKERRACDMSGVVGREEYGGRRDPRGVSQDRRGRIAERRCLFPLLLSSSLSKVPIELRLYGPRT